MRGYFPRYPTDISREEGISYELFALCFFEHAAAIRD
jgi:hypothetical protein